MTQLFLLEVFVREVELGPYIEEFGDENDIVFNIEFSDIFAIDLVREELLDEEREIISGQVKKPLREWKTFPFNVGKTCLFGILISKMSSEMTQYPLEITLEINKFPRGRALHFWKPDFIRLVEMFQERKTVSNFAEINIKEDIMDRKSIGSVNLLVRLSCFGSNLETMFQYEDSADSSICTFKNNQNQKVFKCNDYEKQPHDKPVVPPIVNLTSMLEQNMSWLSVFGGVKDEDLSAFHDDDAPCINMGTMYKSSAASFDGRSLCGRPPENKFVDLMQFLTAEVTTNKDATIVTVKMDRKSGKELYGSNTTQKPKKEPKFKRLCTSPLCPVAMRFKEYGLGPRATGIGAGTVYDDTTPDVCYKMSQTYGTLSHYGPFGVLVDPDAVPVQDSSKLLISETDRPDDKRTQFQVSSLCVQETIGSTSSSDVLKY